MRKLKAIFRPFVIATIALAWVTAWGLMHLDERGIVLYGTVLQLVAMYVVVRGLLGSLSIFAPEKLANDVRSWVGELAFWRAPPSTGTLNLRATLPALTMTGGILVNEPPPTLEEQVDELRRRLDGLHKAMVQGLAQHATDAARQVEDERLKREAELAKIREEIAAVTVADPWTTLYGTLCLFVGVLLAGSASYIVQYR